MPFTEFETARIEAAMSDFMAKRRPPVEIRDKLDLAYRIEGQSVVIFEIRPFWRDVSETIEGPARCVMLPRLFPEGTSMEGGTPDLSGEAHGVASPAITGQEISAS